MFRISWWPAVGREVLGRGGRGQKKGTVHKKHRKERCGETQKRRKGGPASSTSPNQRGGGGRATAANAIDKKTLNHPQGNIDLETKDGKEGEKKV